MHSANVGLVGDGLGVQLEHHRKSNGFGGCDGGFFALGDLRGDAGDAVGLQQLLRFVLGENACGRCCAPRRENLRGAGAVGLDAAALGEGVS